MKTENRDAIFEFEAGARVTGLVLAGTERFSLLAFEWQSGGKQLARMRTLNQDTGEKLVYELEPGDQFMAMTLGVALEVDLPVVTALFGDEADQGWQKLLSDFAQ
jgi:hypothetical protein